MYDQYHDPDLILMYNQSDQDYDLHYDPQCDRDYDPDYDPDHDNDQSMIHLGNAWCWPPTVDLACYHCQQSGEDNSHNYHHLNYHQNYHHNYEN